MSDHDIMGLTRLLMFLLDIKFSSSAIWKMVVSVDIENEICGFVGNVEGVLLIYGCCPIRPFPTPLGPIFILKIAFFPKIWQILIFR